MEYSYFETNDSDEISLYVFSAEPTEFDELTEFGYACAEKGYKNDSQMLKNQSEKYGYEYESYPWDEYIKEFTPSLITIPMFLDKRDYCICMTGVKTLYKRIKKKSGIRNDFQGRMERYIGCGKAHGLLCRILVANDGISGAFAYVAAANPIM